MYVGWYDDTYTQVPLSTCTLLVDVDRPWREVDKREPRYRDQTDEWAPLACRSFLDAEASRTAASHLPRWQRWQAMLARTLWLPPWLAAQVPYWDDTLHYGDYCILQRSSSSSFP